MTDAKADQIRRLGLYFGPFILASTVARAAYRATCVAPHLTFTGALEPIGLSVAFLAGSLFLAWELRDPIGRAAFGVLACRQFLLVGTAFMGVAVNLALVNVLLIVAAILLTVSGARFGPRWGLAAVAGVFVATFLLSWGARANADVVFGRTSVLKSSTMCP